jgi:hypothetical protein
MISHPHILGILKRSSIVLLLFFVMLYISMGGGAFSNPVILLVVLALSFALRLIIRLESVFEDAPVQYRSQLARLRKNFVGLTIMAMSVVLMFGFLEVGTRVLVAFDVLPDLMTPYEVYNLDWYYAASPFPDFRSKSAIYTFHPAPGEAYWLMEDKRSHYVNITHHIRHTTDQPADYARTIYMFGGSTLYSTEVPDAYTIPSYLQRLIVDSFGDTFQVVNLGVPGYNTFVQLERLQDVELEDGDIVVFYDGTNNVFLDTTFSPARLLDPIIISRDDNLSDREVARRHFIAQLNLKVIEGMSAISYYSRFFQYLTWARWDLLLNPEYDAAYIEMSVENSISNFNQDIQNTIIYLSEQEEEIQFVHFLQPVLFTLSQPTEREAQLLENFGTDFTYRRTYQGLQALSAQWQGEGLLAYDLTHVLDPAFRPAGQEVFFDYCHVNHYANAIIAEAMFVRLAPLLAQE